MVDPPFVPDVSAPSVVSLPALVLVQLVLMENDTAPLAPSQLILWPKCEFLYCVHMLKRLENAAIFLSNKRTNKTKFTQIKCC